MPIAELFSIGVFAMGASQIDLSRPGRVFRPQAISQLPAMRTMQETAKRKARLAILAFGCALSGGQALTAQNQGEWTVTGNMQSVCISGAAVPLGNGALVIGGSNGVMPLASAEIYSASTGKWTVTGNMAEARMLFPAVVLQNKKVLVEGGSATNTVLSGAELYDPVSGTWSSAGSLAFARINHAATLLQDGKVLVTGGCTTTTCALGSQTSVSELYDPATNNWTTVGTLNTPRDSHTATLLNNGQVLVVGGYVAEVTTPSELYDPTTGTWSLAPGVSTRYLHAATLLPDGTVLITGGTWSNTAFYETAIYDPVANVWKSTGVMNSAHFSHTATLLPDDTVLVASGAIAWLACGHRCLTPDPTPIAEIYNPATGIFTTTGNLSQARVNQTAALLASGQLLTQGGVALLPNSANQVFLNSAEFYVPLTLSISSYSQNFGMQQLGVPSPSQIVTVANASNRTVAFTSIAASGDYSETNTCTAALIPGQNCTITVTFSPTAAGIRNGAITLIDNSLASPTQTIVLTGTGEPGAMTLLPSSIAFPGTIPGTSSQPMSVTLTNDGSLPVNITAISISSVRAFTQTNNCPTALNHGQNCIFQVVFTPPDSARYKAALSVTDSAMGSPQKASLSGTGLN